MDLRHGRTLTRSINRTATAYCSSTTSTPPNYMPWRVAATLGIGVAGGFLGNLLAPWLGLVLGGLAATAAVWELRFGPSTVAGARRRGGGGGAAYRPAAWPLDWAVVAWPLLTRPDGARGGGQALPSMLRQLPALLGPERVAGLANQARVRFHPRPDACSKGRRVVFLRSSSRRRRARPALRRINARRWASFVGPLWAE
jgi:hypothetical protein